MNIAVVWPFLPDEFLYRYTIQTHSFYSLFPSCICWHYRKQKCRLTFLFCCFISCLLRSIAALQCYSIFDSFMNTGYKFLCFTSFEYFTLSADSHKYPPFWIFVIEPSSFYLCINSQGWDTQGWNLVTR